MRDEKILVVEDDEDIREMLRVWFSKEGYSFSSASTGEEALTLIEKDCPDLIVLDLMLPGMDGLEVTRRLRKDPKRNTIPIVMLTARTEESEILEGYEAGADDYVTKPFSPRVLTARVQTVLRSQTDPSREKNSPILIHDLTIHPGFRQAYIAGDPLDLSYTEFEILHVLASKPGWVFTRSQIIDAVRGDGYSVSDRSVDAQIFALRKKLRSYREYIETVRSVGYRFKR
ncbi:MAG: response regulator transcription factor [Desulfobacteraceae bacterium]|jgi:two-component system phosphate regulon response regulator PhoB